MNGLLFAPPRHRQKLARVGGKLAVLGLAVDDPHRSHWWHVARPGSWDAPQGSGMQMVTYATSLCRRTIATNGYAADFVPARDALCPACAEQL